ncbi:MAG: mechanosensitive ion channel family protein [Pseudodonghicola sp.]
MLTTLLRLFLTVWLLALAAPPLQAQSLLSLGVGKSDSRTAATEPAAPAATEPTAAANLAEALKQAVEAGVNVVVVGADGKATATGASAASPAATATTPEAEADAVLDEAMMQGASTMMKTQAEVKKFRATLRERLKALPNSFNEVAYILRATSPDGRIMTYVEVLLWNLLFLALGYLFSARVYGRLIARRFIVPRVKDTPQGYLEKMPFLVYRFTAGVIGTLISMAVALILGAILARDSDDLSIQVTVTAIFATFFVARSVSDLWRMILSPFLSQYRMPHFSDREARRLYYWASGLTSFNVATVVFSTWINDFGLNYNVYALLYGALSLIAAIGNVLMLAFNGRAISHAIRGGRGPAQVTWLTRTVSYAWAPVMLCYFIYSWLRLAFELVLEMPTGIPPIAAAYSSFVAIMVVYAAINYGIEHYFARSRSRDALNEELAEAEAAEDAAGIAALLRRHRPAITTYEHLARRVSGILAFGAGIYALVLIWDTDRRLSNNPVVGSLLDVMVVLFLGYIVYHLFRIWIDTRIAEEAPDGEAGELGDEGGAAGASRLATLLPLFRGAILAVVVVSIALIALMEIGINVSPLFAGAGVVGLAVGFGAQTLVRDIFSGAFFLIDDAFRKGEYIDIGDVKGTVEKISVRSFQLRHHLGALHTIPFGEIKVLTNYSRDWVIMKLPLRVTYDTDVEKVRKLIKKLGERLLEDPVIGDNFVQPLKSQGVIEMQDSAMIIRVKFMTKPGDQFLVRKRVYEDIRELFAREGIRFAHREVTVRLADGEAKDLTPGQREAVAGAVQGAIDDGDLDFGGGHSDDR